MNDRSIHTLHWDIAPNYLAAGWHNRNGVLIGIWPAPCNADQFFADAGFVDFADADKGWDQEWERIVRKSLAYLERYGAGHIHNQDDVFVAVQRSLIDRVFRLKPAIIPVTLGILERVLLSTQDSQFPDAVVDFGDSAKVTLRTGSGLNMIWLALAAGLVFDSADLLRELAEGRRVVRTGLDWQHLV